MTPKAIKAAVAISLLLILPLIGTFIGLGDANFFPDPGSDLPKVYIRSDGGIDPPTVPIQRTGNVYRLTGNIILQTLEIQKDNIVLDGSRYLIQGNASWMATTPHYNDAGNNGIVVAGRNNITLIHLTIEACTTGVRISSCSDVSILDSLFINETAPMGTPAQ